MVRTMFRNQHHVRHAAVAIGPAFGAVADFHHDRDAFDDFRGNQADKVRSTKSLAKSVKKSGYGAGGYGGHFRAVQGFRYMGDPSA
jgi:hypothetical protein